MQLFLFFGRVYFVAIWRVFFTLTRIQFAAETNCARYLGHRAHENLCGAISWFTFLLQSSEQRRVRMRTRVRESSPPD